MRSAPDDPSALTPHERLRELTAILANGIHRLRQIPHGGPALGQIPPTMIVMTESHSR